MKCRIQINLSATSSTSIPLEDSIASDSFITPKYSLPALAEVVKPGVDCYRWKDDKP